MMWPTSDAPPGSLIVYLLSLLWLEVPPDSGVGRDEPTDQVGELDPRHLVAGLVKSDADVGQVGRDQLWLVEEGVPGDSAAFAFGAREEAFRDVVAVVEARDRVRVADAVLRDRGEAFELSAAAV